MGITDRKNEWDAECRSILERTFNNSEYRASTNTSFKYQTQYHFNKEKFVIIYNNIYDIFVVWNTIFHRDNHRGETITLNVNDDAKRIIRENKNSIHNNDIILVRKKLNKCKMYDEEVIFIVGKYALFEFLNNYESYIFSSLSPEEVSNDSAFVREYIEATKPKRDPHFRNKVLKKYNYKCIVCGCEEVKILQAAHIKSVASGGLDEVDNGYCLCANHHLLFDAGKLTIDLANNIFCCHNTSEINSSWYKEAEKREFKLFG